MSSSTNSPLGYRPLRGAWRWCIAKWQGQKHEFKEARLVGKAEEHESRLHPMNRRKLYLASFISTLYSLLVVPFNRSVNFDFPLKNRLYEYVSIFSWLLFAILFAAAIFSVITFVERFKSGAELYRNWRNASLLYLAINTIVLVSIWPGFWIWDEFILLQYSVRVGSFGVWQHVFTGLYFTLCMHLFPTAVGIVLFQALFSSVIVGYIVAQTSDFLGNKRLRLLLLLPFLLPPIVLNNFYPLRLTVYSYLEVFLIFRLLVLHQRQNSSRSRYVEMVGMTGIITLLAFWRTEGIYYLLLLPYLFFACNIHNGFLKSKSGWFSAAICLAIVTSGLVVTKATSSPNYQVTASITPLSLMLQRPLVGDGTAENLLAIDRVVNIKLVRSMPSATDIDSFWAGALRSDFQDHLQAYNRAFISLVARNFPSFIDAKLQTLLAANSMTDFVPQVHGARLFLEPLAEDKSLVADFERREPLGKALFPELRNSVIKTLLMLSPTGTPDRVASVVWSALPVTASLFLVLLWSLCAKNRRIYTLIAALILLRFVIVFLTAPAAFFMYYLPVYISGWVFVFFLGAQFIDKRVLGSKPLIKAI